MSMRFWIRTFLGITLVAVLAALGYFVYRSVSKSGAEWALKGAKESYARGVQSLEAGDGKAALPALDEANLQVSKALADIESQKARATTAEASDQLRSLEGQSYWLRARVLRDHAFAKAQADGHPLPLAEESTTGAKFRSVLAIPDRDLARDAVGSVRQAANLLPEDREVQEEALRMELSIPGLAWPQIERVANNLLALEPDNARALYILARFELEQPVTDRSGRSTTPENRSAERVHKSLDYLARLKKVPNSPVWRTLHLEAQAHAWLRKDDAWQKKRGEEAREEEEYRTVLRTARDEASRLATDGTARDRLSARDVQGVFALQLMALEQALADARKAERDPDEALTLLGGFLAFCQQTTSGEPKLLWLETAANSALAAVAAVEPYVAGDPPPQWTNHLNTIGALVAKARDRKVLVPTLYRDTASLFSREAQLEKNRSNAGRREELQKQALQWFEDGLRVCKEGGVSGAALADLNAPAAEMKVIMGFKREEITPHIQALRELKQPSVEPVVALLEGALAQREGRLEKARQNLEQVLSSGNSALTLRAQFALATLYLTTGQPDRALTALRAVDKAYQRFEQLSPLEKSWALAFLRNPRDVTALTVIADLEAAKQKLARFVKENPGVQPSRELIASYEKEFAKLRGKLPTPTPQDRLVRQALVAYYATTGFPDQSRQELAAFRKAYPDSADALRTEIAVLIQAARKPDAKNTDDLPPKLVDDVDGRIRQFIKDNPQETSGRLLWVEWLLRTKRADKAVAYLEDPANFKDGKDDRYNRALAVALLNKGDREGGLKVVRHLPRDAVTDVLLIQALASATDKERDEALGAARPERSGLLRCWEAELALSKGKYEEAVTSYLRATEFTQVRALAHQGLQRALFAMANSKPAQAREVAGRLLKDAPEEPALLLAYAYASLLLDDVGTPADNWDNVKSMAAALNQWEKVATKDAPRATGALTKAEYWLLANRPDRAGGEIDRASRLDPKNVTAAVLGVQVAVDSFDAEQWAEGRKHLAVLKEVEPDAVRTPLLEAMLQQREGKTAEAIKSYERLLEKHPDSGEGYNRLVGLLEGEKQPQKARDLVRRWRKRLPDDIGAARAEVRQLAEDKQVEQAVKTAETFRDEQVQALQKKLADAKPPVGADRATWEKERLKAGRTLVDLEMARGLLQGRALDAGAKWLGRMLQEQPGLEGAEVMLGDIYVSRQEWAKARDHYAAVLKEHKDNFVAANNLAWILATQLNDPETALAVVREACKGRYSGKPVPGDRLNPEVLDTAGVVYTKLGKAQYYPEMRDLFEGARRRYANDPRMFLYLGRAYAGLGDAPRATEMYTAAMKLAGPQGKNALPPSQRDEVLVAARAGLKALGDPAPR
jgi:Tfp pilus assembly protein PilF